jgi:tetratricopeptide (TPR) repeat protein
MTSVSISAEISKAREAHRQGDHAAALGIVDRVLKQSPVAEAWGLRGDIFAAVGQLPEATTAYAMAVNLEPRNAGYLHDLARVFLRSGKFAEAEAALTQALTLAPQAWDIACDLGVAQQTQGAHELSVDSFSRAVSLKPDAFIAHFNLGAAFRELGRLDEAEKSLKAAVTYHPQFVAPMVSLITLMGDRGRLSEAEHWFMTGVRLAPQEPELHQSFALAQLRHGKLREGFAAFDWRFQSSQHALQKRPFPYPSWRGENLTGRKILIWTEQGLGDEILASSMLGDVLSVAASCTVECSERVAPLFRRSFPKATIVVRQDPPDPATQAPFDFQTPIFGLGAHLRPDLNAFPLRPRYLRADPELASRLRQRYRDTGSETLVVGIAWDSTARHGIHKRMPLEDWAPILQIPGITFVSLQYGVDRYHPDIQKLSQYAGIVVDENVDAVKSLDASAAQVAAVDLVITVSNTTAHLAGALGVPVWVMLPDGPGCFWYWFRDRTDSPWYASMRMFRQPKPRVWGPVVQNVAAALVEFKPQGPL